MIYNCENCGKEVSFPSKNVIQSGVSKKYYRFRKYKGTKSKVMKIATHCSKRCYKRILK